MKKIILFVAIFIAASFTVANAQVERKTLVIDYFKCDIRLEPHIDDIRNQVIEGVYNTKRMEIVDANNEASLHLETPQKFMDDYIDAVERLEFTKQMGASYILRASIDNLNVERGKSESGNIHYNSELTLTINFLDANTGMLHGTKTVKCYGGGSLLGAGTTEKKAISGAISVVGDKMKRIIDQFFPLKGTIVEVKEIKKDKLISCYIDLGSGHGIDKGQYIKVSKITTIAGRQSEIEVGTMKIEASVAEDLSECKVTKGHAEIYKAITDGNGIAVETIKARGLMGGLDSMSD